MREIKTTIYNGITLRYIGSFPSERAVYFYYGKGGERDALKSVYISTVEALLNGYDVIYKPQLYLSSAVEKAALDSPRGKIYSIFPKGLETLSSHELGKTLITGGGALSILENDAYYSFSALLASDYVAAKLTRAAFLMSYNGKYCPRFVTDLLSDGKSLGVLKTGLTSHVLRSLIREGAECYDTFSSFLASPRYIAYPRKNGSYGIDGFHFDIMSVRYGE